MQTPARVCRRYTHGQYFKTTSRSLTQKLNSFITSSNFSDTFQLTQAQLKFNPNYGLLNALSSVHHVQCVNIILTSKCRYCRPSSSQGNPRTLQISIHNCNHIIQKLYGGFTYTKSFTEEPWKNSISSKNWGEARMLTFSPSFYYRDRLGQQNSLQQLNWKTMDTGITFLRYCQ